nr:hypothetical protein [Prevotella pallens]
MSKLQRKSSSKRRKVSGSRRFMAYVSSRIATQNTPPSVQAMSEKSSPGNTKMVSTSSANSVGTIMMPGKKRKKAYSQRLLRPTCSPISVLAASKQNAIDSRTSMFSTTEMSRTKSVLASHAAISVDDCKMATCQAKPVKTIAATAVILSCKVFTKVCFSKKLKQTSINSMYTMVSIIHLFCIRITTAAHNEYY